MSPVQISSSAATYSASTVPAFQKRIAGFDANPADALDALWLNENGAVGDVVTQLVDSSGNGRHATPIPGSGTIKRIAGGVEIADGAAGPGFAFNTGLSAKRDFTAFGCVRQDQLYEPGTNKNFPTFFGRFESLLTANQIGGASRPLLDNPNLVINQDLSGTSSLRSRIQAYRNDPLKWVTPSTNVKVVDKLVAPSNNGIGYFTFALSLNMTTKRMSFVSGLNPSQLQYDDNQETAIVDEILATAAWTVMLSHMRGNTVTTVQGGVGLFGVYGRYMRATACLDLITRMQARMALRGVTAY